jgi:hypothetical protein
MKIVFIFNSITMQEAHIRTIDRNVFQLTHKFLRMDTLHDIIKSKKAQKVKVGLLTARIVEDGKRFEELIDILKTGSDVEKGICADVAKHVAKENPEILVPYISTLIEFIDYKASRVRWGVPESLGYVARQFPDLAERAVPKLMHNTRDESTVVRWCAAFALSEITMHNMKLQKKLLTTIEEIAEKEKNNGVKNVYLKASKIIRKERTAP